uniref:Glutaredoxin domain-containing protein n=1 Tax=Salix viminalis TaxID=40686 RepID=A0A6N2LQT9_SALVM
MDGTYLGRVTGDYLGQKRKLPELHESGDLKKLIGGLPISGTSACDTCGGLRFVVCEQCSGSHKIYAAKYGFKNCIACNVNGLIRCPTCVPSQRRRSQTAGLGIPVDVNLWKPVVSKDVHLSNGLCKSQLLRNQQGLKKGPNFSPLHSHDSPQNPKFNHLSPAHLLRVPSPFPDPKQSPTKSQALPVKFCYLPPSQSDAN